MRVALISDIHGNFVALETVLDALEKDGYDQLVCLGDVATIGSQPFETVARLQELDCQFIRGNHETDLLNIPAMEQRKNVAPELLENAKWCAEQLTDNQLQFLDSFQSTIEIQLDERNTMLCFHGSPQSNTDIILAETPYEQLESYFEGYTAQLLVGGHTHVQMLRRHEHQLIINPGSVGEPLSRMPFHKLTRILLRAEYAIVQVHQGAINVELRHIPLDMQKIRQAAEASTNPFDWSDSWLVQ